MLNTCGLWREEAENEIHGLSIYGVEFEGFVEPDKTAHNARKIWKPRMGKCHALSHSGRAKVFAL